MKEPLKDGDRVRVYGSSLKGSEISGNIGVVVTRTCANPPEGYIEINVGISSPLYYYVHPKQLRRLIKKPRREVWVNEFEGNELSDRAYSLKEYAEKLGKDGHYRHETWKRSVLFREVNKKND